MDLLLACRAFVDVAERGSFTRGAAAAGMSQPVASRRIAAFERHLGGRVLDRTGRRPVLTPLGRRVLPSARRLVAAAEALELDAEDARDRPVDVAVPVGWDARAHADVALAAHDHGLSLRLQPLAPAERAEAVAAQRAGVAVVPVPADEASWTSRLGLAAAVAGHDVAHLDALRAGRGDDEPRRLWILPEDDVPHVRDVVTEAAEGVGLTPRQVVVAADDGTALAAVLVSSDVVLTSRTEAGRWDLAWAPLASPDVRRGHDVVTDGVLTPADVRDRLGESLGTALGADR